MADIELVIKIPEEAKRAFDCAESNEMKGSYYDHGGVIGEAIKNGVLLPKGHGRLIDVDAYIDKHEEFGWLDDITVDEFNNITPTIIEAESEETTKRC